MKTIASIKKTAIFAICAMLAVVMSLALIPASAEDGIQTATFEEQVEAAIKDGSVLELNSDASFKIDPYEKLVVKTNGYALSVSTSRGYKVTTIDMGDGETVTVYAYKELGDKLSTMNISLSGNITMMFYFTELPEMADTDYFEVKVPTKSGSYNVKKVYRSDFEDVGSRHLLKISVAAAQQTDKVSFQLIKNGGADKGRLRMYSVRDYADKVLDFAAQYNPETPEVNEDKKVYHEMKNAVTTMLNYGAQAQIEFGYNTNNLANEGIYQSADENPINGMTVDHLYGAEEYNVVKDENKGVIDFIDTTAILENTVALHFNFKYNGDREGYIKATVQREGMDEPVDTQIKKIGDTYYVGISNIPADYFDKMYTVTIELDGKTTQIKYSVLSYVLGALDENSPLDDNTKNAARSMYLYYTWMKQYITRNDKDEHGNSTAHVPGPKECTHTREQTVITKAANCVTEGLATVSCADCGKDIRTETIGVSGSHDFVSHAAVAATCSTYGREAYQTCKLCGQLADANGASINAVPVIDPNEIHGELVTVDAVEATCSSYGHEAYQKCEDCDAYFDGESYSDEIPTSIFVLNTGNHTKVTTVAAKTATCIADGWDTYEKCEDCGVILTENGKVPTTTASHSFTVIEATESTCTLSGHGEYKVCSSCEQLFNMSDMVISRYPVTAIDPSAHALSAETIDEGTDKYTVSADCTDCHTTVYSYEINIGDKAPNVIITASQLLNQAKETGARMGNTVLAEDGSYVTFNPHGTEKAEGYFDIFQGSQINSENPVSGQYLLIKYRTTRSYTWQFFGNANYSPNDKGKTNNTASVYLDVDNKTKETTDGNANFTVGAQNGGAIGGFYTNNDWQTLVIDLSFTLTSKNGKKDYFVADENGEYRLSYLRWDIFDGGNGTGAPIDVAYIAFADNLKALGDLDPYAGELLIESQAYNSDGTYAGNLGIPYNATSENIFFDSAFIARRFHGGSKYKTTYETETNGMPYAHFTAVASGSELRHAIWSDSRNTLKKNVGSHLAIVYRSPKTEGAEDLDFFLSSNLTDANGTVYNGLSLKLNGGWNFAVLDYSTYNNTSKASYFTPNGQIMSLVFDAFNGSVVEGETLDVAYIGMYDTLTEAYEYFLGFAEHYDLENTNCTHAYYTGWHYAVDESRPGMATEARECRICGHIQTRNAYIRYNIDNLYGFKNGKDNESYGTSGGTNEVLTINGVYTKKNGSIAIAGWMGIRGSFASEHFVYRVLDANGNELSDGWIQTPINLGEPLASTDAIWGMIDKVFTRGESDARRVTFTGIDVSQWVAYDNSDAPITIEIGAVAADAPETNNIVYYLALTNVYRGCDHPDTNWEPVVGPMDENGMIYETNNCPHCGLKTRDVKYSSSIDNIRINGVNIARETYLNASVAYNVNVTKVGLGGWLACNGSVSKYVYRIIDENGVASEWIVAIGDEKTWNIAADATTTSNAYVKAIETSGFGLADYRRNVGFTDSIETGSLQQYAEQTITVEFGFIPENNAGTEDAPNVVTFYTLKNVGGEAGILCTHELNQNTNFETKENDPARKYVDCSVCGENYPVYVSVTDEDYMLFSPDFFANKNISSNTKVELKEDESGMPYAHYETIKSFSNENTLYLLEGSTNRMNVGNVIAFLYRTSDPYVATEIFVRGNTAGLSGTHGSSISIDKSGEWRLAIVANNSTWNSTTGVNTLRLDIFNSSGANSSHAIGASFDIAYLAFFSDIQAAYAYYGKYITSYDQIEWCEHHQNSITYTWDSANKIYHRECVCGEKLSDTEVIYRTEAIANGTNGYTTKTENGYVRYTATGASGTDFYVHVYRFGTNVTGDAMVIKYRLVNDGKNASLKSFFAGTTAGGYDGAKGGTVSDNSTFKSSSSFIGDGEWHYMVITANKTANKAFKPNADGSYTWAYLRIGFNPAKFDGSCYLEIDEIAFADTNAAEYYAYKNEAVKPSPVFTVNYDVGNCTIDGQKTVISSALRKDDTTAPIVIDLAGKTLTKPTSLKMGGWLCTRGGVQSFKIRVTKSNGATIENPVLANWVTARERGDIFNAVGNGKGYGDNCKYAGMDSTIIDLTAYAGQTVDFEVVAITRFGQEVVITTVTNVAVPEVPAN